MPPLPARVWALCNGGPSDTRPLTRSSQTGPYDDPPATSDPPMPPTRRSRPRRALLTSNAMPTEHPSARTNTEMSNADRRRLGVIGPTSRRRQRESESPHDADAGPEAGPSGEDALRRRSKRRRVHSPPPVPKRRPHKYGYYGQVETGRLQLELVSCDGGEHQDPRSPATYLGAENVLKYDKSVYCSEQRSCTIVVRHADDTPFALDKLHIIAPENGFTAPVRAGMVYVAMTMADLQKYADPPPHARREGIDTPPYRRRRERSIQQSPERLTLADALRDPEINDALQAAERVPWPRPEDLPQYDFSTFPPQRWSDDPTIPRARDPDIHCDFPPSSTFSPSSPGPEDPDWRPISLSFTDEPGPEDTSSQEVLDYRSQRQRVMRRSFQPELYDRSDTPRLADLTTSDRDRYSLNRLDALMARSRVRDSPAASYSDHLTYAEDLTLAGMDGPDGSSDSVDGMFTVEGGLQVDAVTTARFFIRSGRTKVAIRFDPPVSGRFMMLKLWSGKGNVDVQAIVAKGWGGERFFPAREFR